MIISPPGPGLSWLAAHLGSRLGDSYIVPPFVGDNSVGFVNQTGGEKTEGEHRGGNFRGGKALESVKQERLLSLYLTPGAGAKLAASTPGQQAGR